MEQKANLAHLVDGRPNCKIRIIKNSSQRKAGERNYNFAELQTVNAKGGTKMSVKKSFFILLIILISNICTPATEPWKPETCEQIYKYGWNLPGDFSADCYVNFKDIKDIGDDWWRCNEPGDRSCEHPWIGGGGGPVVYEVINIDINGNASDPCYCGQGPVGNPEWTIVCWNGYYQGEGNLMASPRCEDINEPGTPGTYARAIFIADPCTHDYITGGEGDLLGDGFVKSGGPTDPNPGLCLWGTMAYGGIFDVYVLASEAGSFTIRDSNGTFQSGFLIGGTEAAWIEGKNYIVFRDVWIDADPNFAAIPCLWDPNCVVLSYSNMINGIQLKSAKRRLIAFEVNTIDDPNFSGIWADETPIQLEPPGISTLILAGDYDVAYETNARTGESDHDGPDIDWNVGDVRYIDTDEWMVYDVHVTSDTNGLYKVRAFLNCKYGDASIGLYVDDSTQLALIEEETPEPNDKNFWSGWATPFNLFGGVRRFKWKANQAFFDVIAFEFRRFDQLLIAYCDDPNNPGASVLPYGLGLVGDVNGDCYVDFEDLKLVVEDWAKCNNPEDPNCVVEEPEP